jgi:hypothetical protein
MFLRNTGTNLPDHTVSKPEDHNMTVTVSTVVLVYAVKHVGGEGVYLHSFLTSEVCVVTPRPPLPPEKNHGTH